MSNNQAKALVTEELNLEFYRDAIYGADLSKYYTPEPEVRRAPFSFKIPSSFPSVLIYPTIALSVDAEEKYRSFPNEESVGETSGDKIVGIEIPQSGKAGVIYPGAPFIVKSRVTGSFVMAGFLPKKERSEGTYYDVSLFELPMLKPNQLGMPPMQGEGTIIPRDSPTVLVDYGPITLPKDNFAQVLHEQCWRRSSNSFSLLPGQQKTVVMEQTSGITDTSSTAEEVAATLDTSVSAGWGPISASISASLSKTSSSSHSRMLQNQTTNSIEDVVVNASQTDPLVVFYWELVDIYHIVSGGKIKATIESVQAPPIVGISPKDAKFHSLLGDEK